MYVETFLEQLHVYLALAIYIITCLSTCFRKGDFGVILCHGVFRPNIYANFVFYLIHKNAIKTCVNVDIFTPGNRAPLIKN